METPIDQRRFRTVISEWKRKHHEWKVPMKMVVDKTIIGKRKNGKPLYQSVTSHVPNL